MLTNRITFKMNELIEMKVVHFINPLLLEKTQNDKVEGGAKRSF